MRIAPKDLPRFGFRSCDPLHHFQRSDHQDLIVVHLPSTNRPEHRSPPLTTSDIHDNQRESTAARMVSPLTLSFVTPSRARKAYFESLHPGKQTLRNVP